MINVLKPVTGVSNKNRKFVQTEATCMWGCNTAVPLTLTYRTFGLQIFPLDKPLATYLSLAIAEISGEHFFKKTIQNSAQKTVKIRVTI